MQLSEVVRTLAFVCTENADVTIWLPLGAGMILEKPA